MPIPIEFIGYVTEPESREITDFKVCKANFLLTKEEAKEDLAHLRYILDNGYSGRDYWSVNGVDFEFAYSKINQYIDETKSILSVNLGRFMYSALEGIHDGHLSFMLSDLNFLTFAKKYRAYFANIVVENVDGKLIVIRSSDATVNINDVVECEDGKLYRTLSPDCREFYLIGKRSWTELNSLCLNINSVPVELTLHPCRAGKYNNEITEMKQSAGVDILRCHSFEMPYNDEIGLEFYDCGQSLKDKPFAVWNLLSNGGGNSNFPKRFIEGLNVYAQWPVNTAVLNSPLTSRMENNLRREWEFFTNDGYDLSKSEYHGTLYALINQGVASSGEAAVAYAKSVRNCVLIGENTGGIGIFGDTLTYRLPNSAIVMRVPYKIFLGEVREGEGYTPDYWVDNSDVEKEVIRWLTENDNYIPTQS